MASPLRSVSDHMAQEAAYGDWPHFAQIVTANSTQPTTAGGGVIMGRSTNSITLPTMTSPVTGAYVTFFSAIANNTLASLLLAKEIDMGTLTVSGNSFASGSSMPTGKVYDHTVGAAGSSLTMASTLPVLVATATLTATTPIVTITYTNQAGTGSRTATLTLPTSAGVGTAFLITPHLQSGDSGIRSVQNISISTGSAGTLKVLGLIPAGVALAGALQVMPGFSALNTPTGNYLFQSGDVLMGYRLFLNTATTFDVQLVMTPES